VSGKVKPESARHSAKALADIDAGWVQPAHVDPLVVEGEAKAIFRVIFAPTPCRMMKPAFVNTAVASGPLRNVRKAVASGLLSRTLSASSPYWERRA